MYTWRSNTVSRSFNAMCALIGGSRKAMRCQNNARAANAGLRSGTIKRHQQPRRTRSRPQYRPCSQLLACPPLTAPPLSDTRPSFLAARRTACRSFETMKPASGPVASQNAVIVSMMKPSSSPLRPLTSHPSEGDHPDPAGCWSSLRSRRPITHLDHPTIPAGNAKLACHNRESVSTTPFRRWITCTQEYGLKRKNPKK